MKFDLFTFIAQIINFIILATLLYHFLYKKIIQSIDRREKEITEDFQRANEMQKNADKQREEYETRLRQFDETKEQMLTDARGQAKEEKERLVAGARTEVDQKKDLWIKKIETEKENFLTELQRKFGLEVYSTAKILLQDLANVDLQQQIVDHFLSLLAKLNEDQVIALQKAYKTRKREPIFVISAFELKDDEKEKILNVLSQHLQERPHLTAKVSPESTLGIALELDGFRFNWTTDKYFETLIENFGKVLTSE